MSALTKNERDGLDDVFLSIHSHDDKFDKLRYMSSLLLSNKSELGVSKLLAQAKERLKETKISYFLAELGKKKKNLSK
jgi:hypothetical protein